MIPILYAKDETEWTSNGLGRLSDASSCVVTEERNGIFELEMEYPMTGVHFNDIQVDCFIKTICNAKKDYQLFRIYSITKPINGRCRIHAQHVSYQMLLIPVMPFTAVGAAETLQTAKARAIGDCPFTFWTDNTSLRRFRLDYPKSLRGALHGDQWSILHNFGGDYEWDNWTVKLWVQRGVDKGVVLRYGKNITDLKQEENIQKTYTGILPYWYGMVGETQVLVTLPEKVLYAETADNFPYSRILPVDFTDQMVEKPTVQELRDQGEYYIQRNEIGIPSVSISLNFVDISQTEEYKNLSVETLNLCDLITVEFSELGVSKKAKITRTQYDVLRERYTKLYIGDNYHSIATLIAEQKTETQEVAQTSTNFMLTALAQATSLLNGDLTGSSMKTLTDADGNPIGLIFMDTNDPTTAVNCIRINSNGIGFSNNGVNGPYSSTWDITNTFNAANINVINMSASSLNAGTLKDSLTDGDLFSLNLETGDVHIKSIDDNFLSNQNAISELYQSLDNTTEELTSVKGSVTSFSSDLSDFKEETSTTISQTADRIEFDFDQRFTQVNNSIGENSADLADIHRYIRFVNGNIELGEEGSPIKQVIQNDKDSFYYNGVEVAYISDNKLYITEAEILSGIVVGKHKWLARGDRMTLVYTG